MRVLDGPQEVSQVALAGDNGNLMDVRKLNLSSTLAGVHSLEELDELLDGSELAMEDIDVEADEHKTLHKGELAEGLDLRESLLPNSHLGP